MKKILASFALATFLLGLASPAMAGSKEGDMAFDLLVARPAAWAYLATGVVYYVPAATVTAIVGKDTSSLEEELITKRYQYAVKRPLGKF